MAHRNRSLDETAERVLKDVPVSQVLKNKGTHASSRARVLQILREEDGFNQRVVARDREESLLRVQKVELQKEFELVTTKAFNLSKALWDTWEASKKVEFGKALRREEASDVSFEDAKEWLFQLKGPDKEKDIISLVRLLPEEKATGVLAEFRDGLTQMARQ
jgi:hypothetical protein